MAIYTTCMHFSSDTHLNSLKIFSIHLTYAIYMAPSNLNTFGWLPSNSLLSLFWLLDHFIFIPLQSATDLCNFYRRKRLLFLNHWWGKYDTACWERDIVIGIWPKCALQSLSEANSCAKKWICLWHSLNPVNLLSNLNYG